MSASGKCSFESGFSGECAKWCNARGDKFDWSIKSGRTHPTGRGRTASPTGAGAHTSRPPTRGG
eukprot:4272051-Alexandrium_andersonii.AAC.1